METEISERLKGVDWPFTYKRLVLHTDKLIFYRYPRFRSGPGSQNLALGLTSEDIAQSAIEKVISGRRSWPEGLDLFVVLKQVARSVLSNLVVEVAKKPEFLLLDNEDSPINAVAQTEDQSMEDFYKERWQVIQEAVESDDDLQLLKFAIEHALDLNEKPTRSNLAAMLEIPPQEVTNQRRRLDRLVRKLMNDKLKTVKN